jgi:VanZ family protein
VALWACVIFTFSTDRFSSENTQGIVVDILHTLLPFLSQETLCALHNFIRKCAHVGEYFVLGVLLFRAVRTPREGWQWRWAFLAILIAAFYASSDEMHQIFVPSRGASVWDALLDTGGASVAQFVVWMVNRRAHTFRNQKVGSPLS